MTDVTQGDTLNIEARIKGRVSLVGTTCHLQVRDSADVLAGVDRAIIEKNETNSAYLVQLTTAETEAMSVGAYTVSIQISDSSTGQRKEQNLLINITKQYNF